MADSIEEERLWEKLRRAMMDSGLYKIGCLQDKELLLKAAGRLIYDKFYKSCQAGHYDDVLLFLDTYTLDLDALGNDHKTALYHAIASQSLPTVRLILKHGADVSRKSFVRSRVDKNVVESCDEPPVVTAARAGTREILSCLLAAGADPNDVSEIPYCHGGASGGRGRGESALYFACESADVEMVRMLVRRGADVNAPDSKGQRPLHVTARCRPTACVDQLKVIAMLCTAGADRDALNKKDYSPLYLAALYGCTAKVEALLRHGARINGASEQDSMYGSALHVASYKDRIELAAFLICAGAQLDRRNGHGYTPLSWNISSQSKSGIASLLVYHGARLDDVDPRREGMTLLATCIGNLRLDCESLAVLMVQAGYNLNRDLWLVPDHDRADFPLSPSDTVAVPNVHIAPGRVRRLCDWLRRVQMNPHSLAECCRTSVRRHLAVCTRGTSIVASVGALPLPTVLKNFILLKDPSGSTMECTILDYLISVKASEAL